MDQNIKEIADEYFANRKTQGQGKFIRYELNKETDDTYEFIGHYKGKNRRYIHKLIVSKAGIILIVIITCFTI